MKVKAYLNNKMVGIFVICATILIFPMFLQTLERPVGLWDYFTAWDFFTTEDAHGMPANRIYDSSDYGQILSRLFLTNDSFYRPFSGLFYYFFVRIFWGNFWILLCLKWISKFLCLYILWNFHKRLEGKNGLYCFVFSFLFFHTACFEVMTFSADGFAALFSLWLTFYIFDKFCKYQSFHLKAYTTREYMMVLMIFLLTSGQKEICVVLLLTTIGLYTISSICEKSWSVRLVPLYLITLFVVARILKIAISRISSNTEKSVLKLIIRSIQLVTEFDVAYGFIAISLALICFFAGYKYMKYSRREVGKNIFICYLLFTIFGMILFNSISVEQMAARYVIPVYFLFAEFLLLISKDFKHIGNTVLTVLGICIPILCLSNLYAQHLAYANQFEEQQILFNYILNEKEENPDLQIVVTGKDEVAEGMFAGMELQRSIKEFYGYLGNKWYCIPQYNVITLEEYLNNAQYQNSHALWMTTYKVSEAQKQIKRKSIEKVCIAKPHIYVIKKIYEFWVKIDELLGLKSTVTYDMGSCELRKENYWNLYVIRPEITQNNFEKEFDISELAFVNYTKNENSSVEKGEKFVIKKGECAKLYIDLSEQLGNQLCSLSGTMSLNSGSVFYGFSDKEGHTYCTYELNDKKEHVIECSFFFNQINDIVLFFFIPEQEMDTEFELDGISIQTKNTEILENIRSYGSFQ